MDEDTWNRLAPWRVTPMFCSARTKAAINEAADAWDKRHDRHKRATASADTTHGYKAGFKRNTRKIGFGR